MLKINKWSMLCLMFLMNFAVLGQNNTNSPYSRFGYGELANRSFGIGRSMGGLGIGLRSSQQINPMNAASYTAMDTLTFLFDIGASAQMSWLDDGSEVQKNVNGNFEYVALQFPFSKNLAASVGLLPFSYVGYEFGTLVKEENLVYSESFVGSGGLNELYVGLAYEPWKNRLSVGANLGFMFGTLKNERNIDVETGYDVFRLREIRAKDIKFDFGLQYVHPFSKTENITFGATFKPKQRMNAETYDYTYVAGVTSEELADTILGLNCDLPMSLGFGLSYNKANKLTVGADVAYEKWSNVEYFGESDQFADKIRVALGANYIKDARSKNYLSRVQYRIGAHYSNSYLIINDSDYKEYGLSLGFGLPLIDNRSFINVGFEYSKVKPSTIALIDEQYFRFTVNYTFNEMWFYKMKIN